MSYMVQLLSVGKSINKIPEATILKKKKKSVCFSQNRSFNDGDSMQNADPHVKASRLASVRCKYMGSRVCAALIFFHAAFVTA